MSTQETQYYHPGDIVSLKSAGVACTVLSKKFKNQNGDERVSIGWFDQAKCFLQADVSPLALKHLDTDKDYQNMLKVQSINLELQLKQATQAKQDSMGLVSRQAGVKGPRAPIKN